jgi:peptidoglycan hydrolase-like protein with peptidoglycan-binding domain
LQARLRQLGFYTGAVDGVWGAGSLSSFEAFQQAHGLPADGRLTAASVSALGIDPASMQPR